MILLWKDTNHMSNKQNAKIIETISMNIEMFKTIGNHFKIIKLKK